MCEAKLASVDSVVIVSRWKRVVCDVAMMLGVILSSSLEVQTDLVPGKSVDTRSIYAIQNALRNRREPPPSLQLEAKDDSSLDRRVPAVKIPIRINNAFAKQTHSERRHIPYLDRTNMKISLALPIINCFFPKSAENTYSWAYSPSAQSTVNCRSRNCINIEKHSNSSQSSTPTTFDSTHNTTSFRVRSRPPDRDT